MTMELVLGVSGANLLALIGYAMRQESRITKMETIITMLACMRSGENSCPVK